MLTVTARRIAMSMFRDETGIWVCAVDGNTFKLDKRFNRDQVFTVLLSYRING